MVLEMSWLITGMLYCRQTEFETVINDTVKILPQHHFEF